MAPSPSYGNRGAERETVLAVGFEGFWIEFCEKHPAWVTRLGSLEARRFLREAFDAGASVQLVLAADVVMRDAS